MVRSDLIIAGSNFIFSHINENYLKYLDPKKRFLVIFRGINTDYFSNKKITDLKKKYSIEDMIKGDVIFCASGVTDGEMLKGISYKGDSFEASSFVLHKSQKLSKKITNIVKK